MRKLKAKWPVKELMARRQRRLLRGWLRHVENLNGPKEMVQVYEPETRRNLNDVVDELGSAKDLKDCQEDSQKIPNCQEGKELRFLQDLTDCHENSQGISHFQEGNEMRSLWDLTDYHEDSREISRCQEGNDMRSLRDLMDFQEGSRKFPNCQVGMGTEMALFESLINSDMSLDQPVELMDKVSSEMDLDQPE
jgi:hypothetical protein